MPLHVHISKESIYSSQCYIFTIVCTACVQYVPYEPQEYKNSKDIVREKIYRERQIADENDILVESET